MVVVKLREDENKELSISYATGDQVSGVRTFMISLLPKVWNRT
jgi:hypothetical protein